MHASLSASRGRLAVAVLVALFLTVTSGFTGAVRAVSNAQEQNSSGVFATTALYAPSALTATVSGHDVSLGWAAGTNGNGYSVLGVANGASSDCSAAPFAALGSSATLTSTDTGRFTPQGTWYCYQVQTSYGSWTSASGNPTVAARLGFFAASVALANGGTANRLDTGDSITITFNQAMTTATGPSGTNKVCSTTGGVIQLGATATTGTCSAVETDNLGSLRGGSTTITGRWNATYTWSAGNTVLTIVLGTRVTGTTNVAASGTWTLNPVTTTTKLLSATGAFHACDTNAGGGNCLPVATGSF